jgi:hypothetical protein
MLGLYESFPETVHGTACFAATISNKRLQQALLETLQKLNTNSFSLEAIADPSIRQCAVNFEFGIAETNGFNYLSDEETKRALKTINKKPFQNIDFFCAIRYHKTQNEKKTPLRFDYYMLRFGFEEHAIEMLVAHERGPRYMSPEDIINLVTNKVNETSPKKILKALDTS